MSDKELVAFLKNHMEIKAAIKYFDHGSDGTSGEILEIKLTIQGQMIDKAAITLNEHDN